MDQGPTQAGEAPECFDVAVILDRRASNANPWSSDTWNATGVVAASGGSIDDGPQRIRGDDTHEQFLWPGFELRLHRDEGESYHYNLTSDNPGLFVVCRFDDNNRPEPFLVTAAYDEAAAYMESDETVYRVPMPAEIYRWVEAFVLANYVPAERKKRKRKAWTEERR